MGENLKDYVSRKMTMPSTETEATDHLKVGCDKFLTDLGESMDKYLTSCVLDAEIPSPFIKEISGHEELFSTLKDFLFNEVFAEGFKAAVAKDGLSKKMLLVDWLDEFAVWLRGRSRET